MSQQLVPPPWTGGHVLAHSESVVQLPHIPPPLLEPLPELLPVPLLDPEPLLDPVPLLEPLLEPAWPLLEPLPPPELLPESEPASSPKSPSPPEESLAPQAAIVAVRNDTPRSVFRVELRMGARSATVVPRGKVVEMRGKEGVDGPRWIDGRCDGGPGCTLRVQLGPWPSGHQGKQQKDIAVAGSPVAVPVGVPPPETAQLAVPVGIGVATSSTNRSVARTVHPLGADIATSGLEQPKFCDASMAGDAMVHVAPAGAAQVQAVQPRVSVTPV